MPLALSTALAQRQTDSLAQVFSGGFLRIFAGTKRGSPDQAETQTLLGVVSVDALAGAGLHLVADGAALAKSSEVWAFKALANGTATWFSLVTAHDHGDSRTTDERLDGTIGDTDAPGDMTWSTQAVVLDRFYTIDSFLYLLLPI